MAAKDDERTLSERTPLLHAPRREPTWDSTLSTVAADDDAAADDSLLSGDFGEALARTVSCSSAVGVLPEAQVQAVLQHRPPGSAHGGLLSKARDEEARGAPVDAEKGPYNGVSSGKFWIIFCCLLTSHFLACFDATIMASSHPVVTSYFHASNSASWLSTSFLLTSTAFQPLFGRLSDTIGRKAPYLVCVTIFLAATVWCALAPSMLSFIMARALCGLGAGGAMTMFSIIVSDLVPIEVRSIFQSYINICYGAGSALGAATGGLIADSLGWRWEFGIQVPGLVLCLIVAILVVPSDIGLANKKRESLWEALSLFDFKGSILLTTSMTCLILGVNLGGNVYSWGHPIVIAALIYFAVAFPVFLYVETRVSRPIMPLSLLRVNPRSGLIFSNFLGALVVTGIMFNMPLYFQAVLQYSATASGLRLIVPSAVASICGAACGFIIGWTRRMRWSIIDGVALLLVGCIGLASMTRGLPEWAYVLYLLPGNIGQGFLFPGTFISILTVSEQAEQAVVTSTLILWRSLGNILGVATSSLVVQNALVYFLNLRVDGPDKDKVIADVRKSVEAVAKLPMPYHEQVIDAYAASLRTVYICLAAITAVSLLLVMRVKLPRLPQKK